MEYLLVCGTFDDDGGKPSGYMKKLYGLLTNLVNGNVKYVNGGKFSLLELVLQSVTDYDVVLWFPNITNDKPKLVKEIKVRNKKCMLVTSKYNDGKYTFIDLISRALQVKSNLLVEFIEDNKKYKTTIIDPLGNIFSSKEPNINVFAITLIKRLDTLSKFIRIPSMQLRKEVSPKVPDELEFFLLSSKYAEKFHELVHGANPSRFLGNLSFRCTYGFPSFRSDSNVAFISKRNIDKREINVNSFVPVDLTYKNNVAYYGDVKPSVDSPIQVKLYNYYKNINYILHSHTYIKDAIETENIIPCGAIEEFYDIVSKFPDSSINSFRINIKGHGSLALSNQVSFFENIEYIKR
jgi:hypothetical protein